MPGTLPRHIAVAGTWVAGVVLLVTAKEPGEDGYFEGD